MDLLPPALQQRILGFALGKGDDKVANDIIMIGNTSMHVHLDDEASATAQILSDIFHFGYSLIEAPLDAATLSSARQEIDNAVAASILRHRGVGAGQNHRIDPSVRSDLSAPVNNLPPSPPIDSIVHLLNSIRSALSRSLSPSCPLHSASFQTAFYPPDGARYARHTDLRDGDTGRALTSILYLNENWVPEHGGVLRLFLPSRRVVDVAPLNRRILVFPSATPHEVLPSFAPRYAISGWFYSRTPFVITPSPPPPPPPLHPNGSLFVSVASYRDPDLSHTLTSVFQNAAHPDRIVVGLCVQDEVGDPPPTLPPAFSPNVRVVRIPAREAKGPCLARSLAQGLFAGEMFYLQIDR
jgi:SM-20-related protein